MRPEARLSLPTVTLCAATSVNLEATIEALRRCMAQAEFAQCLLLTDAENLTLPDGLRRIAIPRMTSGADYSRFMLTGLHHHIASEHLLIVQWDGFIRDAGAWDAAFLEQDYIGAIWPQFPDGHRVGNGGFSLRSRRLLSACLDPDFRVSHPEDVSICRANRRMLEQRHGIQFADEAQAARFAFERARPKGSTFGFHGAFNIIEAVGSEGFWDIYRNLDDRTATRPDVLTIARALGRGRNATARRARLLLDWLFARR